MQEAKAWGKRVAAHARSHLVDQGMRASHGIEVIYHASFADEEALDMLEAHKFEHFVAPGLAWLINTCHNASAVGSDARGDEEDGLPPRARMRAIESMRAMRKRGIRILPGGDYGFAWTPHGTNAKDLEYFVKHVGMSTMEALLSATAWGGPMMSMGKQLGYIREGCLADILLVDGDPLADITVLQDKSRILAVMKDGEFHRAPPGQCAPCAAARRPRSRAGRLEEQQHERHPVHQRPHPRRHAAATPTRQRAGAGQPHPPGRPQHRADLAQPAPP